MWRKTKREGVDLHLGRSVRMLDAREKSVTDDQGTAYTWDTLLLATGGTPRRFSSSNGRVIYFRTLDDYVRLRAQTEDGQRFAVVGAGFIGSEIAAALAMNGKDVILLFPEKGIGGRIFPPDLAESLNAYYRQQGVDVQPDQRIIGLETQGGQAIVVTRGGRKFLVDGVVAGLGIEPNTELARSAGLKIENGIEVDEWLRTSQPNIYGAGDAAAFYNPALGKRIRVEHEDNANTMGRAAGRAMAGDPEPYHHLPFFY